MMMVYGAVFAVAASNGLFLAAMASYFKLLVPRPQWERMGALRGMLSYGALVLGSGIAGALLIHGKPRTAIWLDAATFLFSAASLLFLPVLNPATSHSDAPRHLMRGWLQDMQLVRGYFRSHWLVLGVLAGFSGIVIFGSAALRDPCKMDSWC